jgi:hypothetical protein
MRNDEDVREKETSNIFLRHSRTKAAVMPRDGLKIIMIITTTTTQHPDERRNTNYLFIK